MANRDEVEEFLRRAAARRAAAQAQQQQRQQAPQQWIAPQSPTGPQRRPPLAEVVLLEPAEPLHAQVVDAELAGLDSQYVARHLRAADQVSVHAQHLGDEVDLADDKLEARLQRVFDHKVGVLKRSTMEDGAASPSQAALDAPLPGAASIALMLTDPQSLRNAFIMSEILKRPEENW